MRRPLALLLVLAAPLLAVPARSAGAAADPDCRRTLNGVDLQTATVLDLRAAMSAGRLSSVDLVRAYLERIAAYDPPLSSVRAVHPTALEQARAADAAPPKGPLHGVPVLLKDNVGTNDMPTTAGSIALAGNVPPRDAFLVERLRAAGAVVLGKTNLSEFANWVSLGMPNGYSSLGGQVVNAHNGGDPSGSSSGSGVAGSMAFAAVTVGTETSGSILSPSDANGLVGVKPTVGLVSRAGVIPLAQSFDTAGPMARTVTDAAALLEVVAGTDPRDAATAEADTRVPDGALLGALSPTALAGVRLGVAQDDEDALDAEEAQVWARALDDLRAAGAEIVEMSSLPASGTVGLTEIAAIPNEFKYGLNRYLAEEAGPGLPVRTLSEVIEFNKQHPDKVKYGQNLLEASNLTLGIYDEPTAIANRTAAIQGSRAAVDAALLEGDLDAVLAPGPRYANVGAAAGYPTVLVPAGYTRDGERPMGVSFLGTAWSDPRLLGYAYAYEQASRRRVPVTELNPSLVPDGCRPFAFGGAIPRPPAPAPRPGPGDLPATGLPGGLPVAAAAGAVLAVLAVAAARRGRPAGR